MGANDRQRFVGTWTHPLRYERGADVFPAEIRARVQAGTTAGFYQVNGTNSLLTTRYTVADWSTVRA